MPIRSNHTFRSISKDEFKELNYIVMGEVFSIHNDLGRFCNEKIYQNELLYRCASVGIEDVAAEVPIYAIHGDFKKDYYIDLIVNAAVIYELKTVVTLNNRHIAQILNYVLMTGVRYGKLVNMHQQSIQDEIVSTTLTHETQRLYSVNTTDWHGRDADSRWLKEIVLELLDDWGAFLEVELYYEAITNFRGGTDTLLNDVDIVNNGRLLGKQKFRLLNHKTAFVLSSATKNVPLFGRHLRQLLKHTPLSTIQWINLNRHEIDFVTIKR